MNLVLTFHRNINKDSQIKSMSSSEEGICKRTKANKIPLVFSVLLPFSIFFCFFLHGHKYPWEGQLRIYFESSNADMFRSGDLNLAPSKVCLVD